MPQTAVRVAHVGLVAQLCLNVAVDVLAQVQRGLPHLQEAVLAQAFLLVAAPSAGKHTAERHHQETKQQLSFDADAEPSRSRHRAEQS